MKLTPVNKKLFNSIRKSMHLDVSDKTYDSASREVRWKIIDEIQIPNRESIEEMQRRTLNSLKNFSK